MSLNFHYVASFCCFLSPVSESVPSSVLVAKILNKNRKLISYISAMAKWNKSGDNCILDDNV